MEMFHYIFAFSFINVAAAGLRKERIDRQNKILYERPGNISITGVFNGLVGDECFLEAERVLEEMTSTIWIVEALNKFKFLSNITIGLTVVETCSSDLENRRSFFRLSQFPNTTYDWGELSLLDLTGNEENNFVHLDHIMNFRMLAELTAQLLINLHWFEVDVLVTESEEILKFVNEKFSIEGIHLINQLVAEYNSEIEVNMTGVVVIFASSGLISKISEQNEINAAELVLIPTDFTYKPLKDFQRFPIVLLPSIGEESILRQFLREKNYHKDFFNHREPTKSPLFIGVATAILKLIYPLKHIQDKSYTDHNFNDYKPCSNYSTDVLKLSEKNQKVLENMTRFCDFTLDHLGGVLETLKIDVSSNSEMFLFIATVFRENSTEDAAIFQILNLKAKTFHPTLLKINDDLFRYRESRHNFEKKTKKVVQIYSNNSKLDQKSEISAIELLQKSLKRSVQNLKKAIFMRNLYSTIPPGSTNISKFVCNMNLFLRNETFCQNLLKNTSEMRKNETSYNTQYFPWRYLTWVTVNSSVACMGFICTISVTIFIMGRVCKRSPVRGSPFYTIILMISVTLTFLASLPYHVELLHQDQHFLKLLCGFREHCPPLAFGFLFSLLLSRGLILASSENTGGFVSHINGYLQFILFLFIYGVQVSLTLQNWARENYIPCRLELNHEYNILLPLTYNFILLVFLVCICPFIIRSKRNNREGLFFSISIFFVVISWFTWVSFYWFLPYDLKDVAIAVGLNTTATILLIFLFIPRVYFIAVNIIKSNKQRSMVSSNQNIIPDITENRLKLSSQLCHNFFGSTTNGQLDLEQSNPNLSSIVE